MLPDVVQLGRINRITINSTPAMARISLATLITDQGALVFHPLVMPSATRPRGR
jgi:hypothetical protein